MSEISVKNRLTHDREGHAYGFSLSPDGELQVNGCTAETWLRLAQNNLETHLRASPPDPKLAATLAYVDKAVAAILNKPVHS